MRYTSQLHKSKPNLPCSLHSFAGHPERPESVLKPGGVPTNLRSTQCILQPSPEPGKPVPDFCRQNGGYTVAKRLSITNGNTKAQLTHLARPIDKTLVKHFNLLFSDDGSLCTQNLRQLHVRALSATQQHLHTDRYSLRYPHHLLSIDKFIRETSVTAATVPVGHTLWQSLMSIRASQWQEFPSSTGLL